MKRMVIVLLLAIVLVGVLSAPALAAKNDLPQGLKGADEVLLGYSGVLYDNPGKMFQAIRDEQLLNPAGWAKDVREMSVGEFIYERGQAAGE